MASLLFRNGARPIVIAEAAATPIAAPGATTSFRAIGYRQTLLSAAKGGKLMNANGWRFRNGGMRALARTFRGQAFIGGHEWGDPRLRGGDIADAWAEELQAEQEMAIFYDIVAKAPWALEGLANGTIDRFSLGVLPIGEITCTLHEVPVWSTDECYCWPGETVDGVIAEWEFEDGEGLELSAVNVPAVDGTGIVSASASIRRIAGTSRAGAIADREALAALCGREPRGRARSGGAPVGGFTRAEPARTMTPMDPREEMAKALGLPITATWDEIRAKQAQVTASAAQADVARAQLAEVAAREQQAAQERDAAHVESEIARLRAARVVGDAVIEKLRAAAKAGRASFDASLALVEESAPKLEATTTASGATVATTARATLQSDAPAAANPGAEPESFESGPDAYEQHRANPNVAQLARWARITVADIRKHGAREINILPNLRELADATARRGA